MSKQTIQRMAIASLFAGFLLAGCGGGGGSDSKVAEADAELKQSVESSSSAEAREWLKGSTHLWFPKDGSKTNITLIVEDFYSAGAEKVFITDIEKPEGNEELAASIVVVVPQDIARRKKVFAIDAKAAAEAEQDQAQDKGQRYLSYGFD